jgi:hypothetical protein
VPPLEKSSHRYKKPAWSYGVKGEIWRIHSSAAGTLVGEERRIDEKKALFFCLDREDGEELWRKESPGDNWWIGIEAVYGDTVFFHGFTSPDLPQHRGIIAVDTLTGKKLWEDKQLAWLGAGKDVVLGSAQTPGGQVFAELDRRSGLLRRKVDEAELPALKQAWRDWVANEQEELFPVPFDQLAAGQPEVASMIRNHCDVGYIPGSIEVAATNDFVILDYHVASTGGTAWETPFTSTLMVIERATGEIFHSDTIVRKGRTIIPELFFVRQDMLYYIRERRTLIAVRLAQ